MLAGSPLRLQMALLLTLPEKAWIACSKADLSLFGLANWSKRASKRSNTASLPLSCNLLVQGHQCYRAVDKGRHPNRGSLFAFFFAFQWCH